MYNPQLYMTQPMTAPMTTPTAQANWYYQPTTQPVNGLVSVTGIEGAKAYQLPPNSSIALFDRDSDTFYLKTTDSAGYPTVKAFSFSPLEQEQEQAGYVSREDFDALAARVEELSAPKPARTARKKADDGE